MRPELHTYSERAGKSFKYAHAKLDGHFTEIITNPQTGKLSIWTSFPHEITPALEFMRLKFASIPPGTIVLGELYVPGGTASDVKTAIKEERKALKFGAFAISAHALYRISPAGLAAIGLQSLELELALMKLELLPFVFDPCGVNVEKLQENLPSGYEGYVLKNGNLLDWHKWKPRKTIDLIVTGFEPGKGKYAGLIGALKVSTCEGKEVANVSGMTDAERESFSRNSETLIGRVVEITYQGVGSQGRLRHPAFVRERNDKPAERCTLTQDAELAAHYQQKELF